MASCLYECLCEAELEKYYPHFAACGLQKIDELAKVSIKDYTKLGVHDMNDRKRLFQLIRIIKIMQEEDTTDLSKQDFQHSGLFIQPQVTRSGPCRQLHFESSFEENDGTVKDSESESCGSSDFSAKEKNSVGEMLGHIQPHDSELIRLRKDLNTPGICTKKDLSCPTVSDDIAPLLGDSDAPIIQRITHISGYNYGLPHSSIRSSTSEKETPWTESEKIRVCVRKRPLGLREERRGEVNIITVKDKETLLLHEKKEAVDLTQYILQHVFYFDEVFGESCTNQDVYMKTAHPLIQHIFNGGNATCFAYGQTGAGKTYTMIGTHRNPGLYALAAKDIFRHLEASPSRKDLLVSVSFYEIYCGQLYDLLNGRKRLFAREDSKHVVQIVGLQEVQVDSVHLLLEVILKGGKERSTGATGVNSDSSRSHAIIQIQIKDTANRTFGRISFIDLAGSERAADARDSDRQTKMEGAEINQSLLALKECIRALDQEHAHTPFRQSKLTQVLKDSFIGNSKTCMIANVSPSHVATEHTLNTLRYADRVKELKKGIKCSTPVTNRRRTAGNVSPKRVQNSPSLPPGEKSSPKKVKLGLQQPSNAANTKTKAYPAALQPPSVPFTSTPRGINKGHAYKGNPSSLWFHHTSPVKGVLRIAHPLKKKADDLSPHSEKNPTVKDFIIKNTATAETKESGQRDKYMQDRPPVQCVKVQTVQPVQKQLVSRDDLSFGDGNLPADSRQEWENTFSKQYVETWTNLPPFQKEREEHLRLYHQQFQQPPILQQKLNYQPLDSFLTQYKHQEIQMKPELSLTPTEVQSKEGMQLEDLDDSDFSEDSFSPICSQKSVKRRSTNKCSQHSFFLHQRERGTEEEQKGQKRQDLFFKYAIPMQEHEVDHNWDCSEGSPKTEESIKNTGCSKTPPDWSYDLTSETSPSNTAEKPYCLQEDPACNWKNVKDFLSDHKQYKSKQTCLVYSSEATLTPEKDASNSYISPVLKSGTPECEEIDLQHEEKEESALDRQAAHAGDVKRKAQINGVNHCGSSSCSSKFTSELMALLDYKETTDMEKVSPNQEKSPQVKQVLDRNIYGSQKRFEEDGWQCTRSRALTDSMLELGEQTRHGGRHCALLHSPQTGDKWLSTACCDAKACSFLLGSDSSKQGDIHDSFVGCDSTETSAVESTGSRGERECGLFSSNSTHNEYSGCRQCDAGVKDNTGNSGKSISNQGPSVEPMAQEINADLPEKSYFLSCLLGAGHMDYTVQPPSQESSLLLQPKPGLRNEDFSHSEDPAKSSFSNEEISLLKNKLMENIFTQDTFAADSGIATKDNKPLAHAKSPSGMYSSSSPSAPSETGKWQEEALEKAQKAVIRAHQQQLDEMASLCFKEECLINQMSAMDFQHFTIKLDEILVLKLKCIQTMRAQLHLCSASPGTDVSLQMSPPV
ncbi:KIF24 protein, partial [Bucorvus abyssinicus]|nr:KIF24 protein [Bucorvus abyssinicus]